MHYPQSPTPADATDRPIRIAIDARPLSGPPCGYTIYLCSVIECLERGNFDITLFSNAELMPYYDEAAGLKAEIFGSAGNLIWENSNVPARLAKDSFDIYFSGANRGMPLKKEPGTRYVLGLLDIIPYIFFGNYFLKNWKAWVRTPALHRETVSQLVSLARADAVVTISGQSARDIGRIFRRRDAKPFLIKLRDVRDYSVEQAKPQFVYLGGIDYRKKVTVLLEAFAIFVRGNPLYKLVLVGSNYTSLLPLIERLGLRDHVVLTGYVDHDTKFRILAESQAMVYPSLYEGYGLAIGEGFQAGIPVIAGRGGSQAEVGGIGVRPIDPSSPEDIAAAMAEMLDPAVRQNWIEKGRKQLAILTDPAIESDMLDYFTEQGRLARAGRARARIV